MTERTAEEWGRLAVSLPGWRWMPGMQTCEDDSVRIIIGGTTIEGDDWPNPDDPATAGCLLALLGRGARKLVPPFRDCSWWCIYLSGGGYVEERTLGRACIAAAAAIGRWPGGEG